MLKAPTSHKAISKMPFNKKKPILIALLLLFLGAITLHYYRSGPENASTSSSLQKQHERQLENDAEIVLDNAVLTLFGYDKVKGCTLKTKKNYFFRDSQKVFCEEIECHLTTKKNEVSVLKTENALIDQAKKELIFSSPLSGFFSDFHLQSASARYYAKTHELEAESILLEKVSPSVKIQSKKALLKLKNQTILLTGNVLTIIKCH
jgi:hypothetical protein